MKTTAVVVLVLFFILLGCVLYLSVLHHDHPRNPETGHQTGAFRFLDSLGNGV